MILWLAAEFHLANLKSREFFCRSCCQTVWKALNLHPDLFHNATSIWKIKEEQSNTQ